MPAKRRLVDKRPFEENMGGDYQKIPVNRQMPSDVIVAKIRYGNDLRSATDFWDTVTAGKAQYGSVFTYKFPECCTAVCDRPTDWNSLIPAMHIYEIDAELEFHGNGSIKGSTNIDVEPVSVAAGTQGVNQAFRKEDSLIEMGKNDLEEAFFIYGICESKKQQMGQWIEQNSDPVTGMLNSVNCALFLRFIEEVKPLWARMYSKRQDIFSQMDLQAWSTGTPNYGSLPWQTNVRNGEWSFMEYHRREDQLELTPADKYCESHLIWGTLGSFLCDLVAHLQMRIYYKPEKIKAVTFMMQNSDMFRPCSETDNQLLKYGPASTTGWVPDVVDDEQIHGATLANAGLCTLRNHPLPPIADSNWFLTWKGDNL